MDALQDPERWRIQTLEDAEMVINILHRRSLRDKTEIDLLTAQVDLLRTPWWRFNRRKATKRWIRVLSHEKAQEAV